MPPKTEPPDTDTPPPRPSNSEIHAAQITVAALSERFDKPISDILADLRRLAASE